MTTTPTSGAAIQRYKIGYHADEWGQRSSTPSGIPDASGSWVRYADHVTALAAGQATAAQQGEAYAELPDERAAFEAWYIAQVRSKTSTTNDWSDDEIRGAWLSRPSEEYRSSFAGQSWEAWQARASHGQAPAKPDPAYSAACHLATALFKKHFAHLSDFASGQAVWSLCDSTAGVILQIDNMVSGLVQPPTTSPQADSVQEDALRYRWLREGNDAKHGAAWHVAVNLYGCELDAAIDAALAAQGGNK